MCVPFLLGGHLGGSSTSSYLGGWLSGFGSGSAHRAGARRSQVSASRRVIAVQLCQLLVFLLPQAAYPGLEAGAEFQVVVIVLADEFGWYRPRRAAHHDLANTAAEQVPEAR